MINSFYKKIFYLILVIFLMGADTMKNYEKATFAGGCFWCMEPPFENLDGVIEVISGYSGGDMKNPTYEQISTGKTGHYEAIQIIYNPEKITYEKLLEIFWKNIDPTDAEGQFADKGPQYRTAIFYHNYKQKELAEKSKDELEKKQIFKSKIKTKILPYKNFFKAEEYHQDYYKKNKIHYNLYKIGSGREGFLKKIWSKEKENKSNER